MKNKMADKTEVDVKTLYFIILQVFFVLHL